MNRVIVMGRLGKDVELKTTQTGKSVANLRLAVPRAISKEAKASGAQDTDWFDVVTWNKTAEFASKYLGKGRQVLVEGRLQTRSYEKDGQRITRVEIMADSVEFADSKPDNQQGNAAPQVAAKPAPQPAPTAAPQTAAPIDDDIPF